MNKAAAPQRISPTPTPEPVSPMPPAPRRRGISPRLRTGIVVLLALVGLAVLGTWLYGRWTHVRVYDARVSADVILIASRVQGWVTGVPVSEGDRVSAGTPLVNIDDRDARIQLTELTAQIDGVGAERTRLQSELKMIDQQTQGRLEASRATLASAQAALSARQSELERAASEFERAQSLLDRLVISRQRWEGLRTSHQTAQQELLRAQADVAEATAAVHEADAGRQQLDVTRNRIQALVFEEARLRAQRDRQALDIADRTITAGINGTVDRIFVNPGEYVAAGQRLMLIHDPDKIWIEANVKETDIRNFDVGSTAHIVVDAYPDLEITGKVVRVGQAATSQFALLPNPNPSGNFTKITQRLPVKIAVDQVKGGLLRPGMMVEVDIVIRRD